MKGVSCPVCRRPVTWDNNPSRPFCSERCRLIDLGHWAGGGYRLPASDAAADAAEDTVDDTVV